ncbi:MAG: hypothetical protein KY455_06295 [Euryarchaeota archaeon]|nr:hypothetical protein [Euryarchaeota archaeon]
MVFVLEYSIERQEGAEVNATHGPHCATAWVDGDRVFVQERNMHEVESADAALLVAPQDPGPRTMHLEESYLLALPSSFEAVRGVVLGSFTFDGTAIRMNGEAIDLPHGWTDEATDGAWRVEATLKAASGVLKTVPDRSCD